MEIIIVERAGTILRTVHDVRLGYVNVLVLVLDNIRGVENVIATTPSKARVWFAILFSLVEAASVLIATLLR